MSLKKMHQENTEAGIVSNPLQTVELTESLEWLPVPLRIEKQSWPVGTIPVISICCITYSHEEFIRDAIEGFLLQETTFPVELLIHDDASTDGTQSIIKEYAEKHPLLIRPCLQSENQFSQPGNRVTKFFLRARGEFVALCEGDDFWTSANKLQLQVSFLRKHANLSLCGHRFLLVDESGGKLDEPSRTHPELGNLQDILLRNYVHTATAVYRRTLLLDADLDAGPHFVDWSIWARLAERGGVGFINDVMSCYRIHGGGIASSLPIERRLTDVRAVVALMHKSLEHRYERIRRQSLAIYEIQCCTSLLYRNRRYDTLKVLALFLRLMSRAPIFAVQQPEMKVLCGAVHSRISAVRVHGWQSVMKVCSALRRRGSVVKQFMKRRFRT